MTNADADTAQPPLGVKPVPAKNDPHVIVLGNEKGGSGKTTTAMHLIAMLMQDGFSVGSLDLDTRQRSLTRYVENRRSWAEANGVSLVMPEHRVIEVAQEETYAATEERQREVFSDTMDELASKSEFIVIDSPGNHTYLSRLGHAAADTLITPLNDSFVDLDLLAHVNPQTFKLEGPSLYSEMVWESRKQRAMRDGGTIDWVVVRNRLSHLDAKNKRRVLRTLEQLSKRIGFRQAPGIGERVIFREMFPSGLTLMDLHIDGVETPMSMSHVSARAELRALVDMLDLPLPLLEMVEEGEDVSNSEKAS